MTRFGRSYGSMNVPAGTPLLADPEAAGVNPFRIAAGDGSFHNSTPQERATRQRPMRMFVGALAGLAVLGIIATLMCGGATSKPLSETTMSAQVISMLATPVDDAGSREITEKEKNDDPHYNRKDAEDEADKYHGKAKDAKDDRDKFDKKAEKAKKEKHHWEKEAEKEHDISKDKKHEKKKDRKAAAKKEEKDEKKEKEAAKDQKHFENKADDANKDRKDFEKKEDKAEKEAKIQGKAEKKERFAVLIIGNNQTSSVHVFRWLKNDTINTVEEIASHSIEPGITSELTHIIPEAAGDWQKWSEGKGDWHKYAKNGADWKGYVPPDPKPGNNFAVERLEKLLKVADDEIPKSFQEDTQVYYIGGSSYKSLDVAAVEQNLGIIRDKLAKSGYKFEHGNVFVADGTREAVFSWLTANQHANRLSKKDKKLIGAVYMGADSTGVVYPLTRLGSTREGSTPIPVDGALTHAGDNKYSLKLNFLPDTAIYAGSIHGFGLDTAFHSLVLEPTHRLHKKHGNILYSSSCLGKGFDVELGADEAEEVKGGKKHDVIITGRGDAKQCEKAVSKATKDRLEITSDNAADEFAATGDLGVLSLLGSDLLPKKKRHHGVRLGDLPAIGDEACDAHPDDWRKAFDGVVETNQVVPPAACVGLSVVNALVNVHGDARHADLYPDVRYDYIKKNKAQSHVAAKSYKEKDFADARVSQGIDVVKNENGGTGANMGDKYRKQWMGGENGKKPAWAKYIPKGVMGLEWDLVDEDMPLETDEMGEIEFKRKHKKYDNEKAGKDEAKGDKLTNEPADNQPTKAYDTMEWELDEIDARRKKHDDVAEDPREARGRKTGGAYENKWDKPVARDVVTLRGEDRDAAEYFEDEMSQVFKKHKKNDDYEAGWSKYSADEADPANGKKFSHGFGGVGGGWGNFEEMGGEADFELSAKRAKKDAAGGWDKYSDRYSAGAKGYAKKYGPGNFEQLDAEEFELSAKRHKKDSTTAGGAGWGGYSAGEANPANGKRYRDAYAKKYGAGFGNFEQNNEVQADEFELSAKRHKDAGVGVGGGWGGYSAGEANPANGKRYHDKFAKNYPFNGGFEAEEFDAEMNEVEANEYDLSAKRKKKADDNGFYGANDEANPANGKKFHDKYAKNYPFHGAAIEEEGEEAFELDAKRSKKDQKDVTGGWDKYSAGEADPSTGRKYRDHYAKGFTAIEENEEVVDADAGEMFISAKRHKKDKEPVGYGGGFGGSSWAGKYGGKYGAGDWGKYTNSGKRYRDAYSKQFGFGGKFVVEGVPEFDRPMDVAEVTEEEQAVEQPEQDVQQIGDEAAFAAAMVDARRRRKNEEYEVHRDSWALGAFLYIVGQGKELW